MPQVMLSFGRVRLVIPNTQILYTWGSLINPKMKKVR